VLGPRPPHDPVERMRVVWYEPKHYRFKSP
jgi:hypothetical protein